MAGHRLEDYPNWLYFADRLEDPSLLEGAVRIMHDGQPGVELAVPIGGKRRGGFVALIGVHECDAAVRQLEGKPGFPALRIVRGGHRSGYWELQWGDPEPKGAVNLGRHFGYSEQAIQKFVERVAARRIADVLARSIQRRLTRTEVRVLRVSVWLFCTLHRVRACLKPVFINENSTF
jgi:hypothetical protein